MSEGRAVRSLCVFCGSRPGDDPAFLRAAAELGRTIARRGLTLIYGGAKVGLMGALAEGALSERGTVVGILPRGLVTKEIAHEGLHELVLTETMHARKELMIARSDAFVSMPGGWGTYDELFEVLTLAQIGFHDKPSGFLNVGGYFDPLLALLEHTVGHGFAAAQHAGLYVAADAPEALLDALLGWAPPPLGEPSTDRRAAGVLP
jgi:uncharacterized protein (TIGR00730 family)